METIFPLTAEDIWGYARFIGKPILILIAAKFIIGFLVKISNRIMGKSRLEAGIAGFIAKALRISLWVLALIIVVESLGVDTTSLVAVVSVVLSLL